MGNNQPQTQSGEFQDKPEGTGNISTNVAIPKPVIVRTVSPSVTNTSSRQVQEMKQKVTQMAIAGDEPGDSSGTSSPQITTQPSQDLVPVVFRWEHLGHEVSICGTFTDWLPIPMRKSDKDFAYIKNLPVGIHDFRFIVDNHHKYADELATTPAPEFLPLAVSSSVTSNITLAVEKAVVNTLNMTSFKPYKADYQFFSQTKEQKLPDVEFSRQIPTMSDMTKEPPLLPPHLRSIVLNKDLADADPSSLAAPSNVSIGHMYCTAIKDNLMVLASTQRFRNKYVTTVFYTCQTDSTAVAVAATIARIKQNEEREATLSSSSVMVLASPYTST